MIETFAAFMRDGGIFMYFILIVSIIGTAIMIERVYVLLFKFNVDGRALWERINISIQEGDMEKARGLCKGSDAPLARILNAGLSASRGSEKDIQNAIDEVALEIMPSIDKRLIYLGTLANISTLLGLLGTIQGLIQAFFAVGLADPSQKSALLASGIAIALYTTFFGLIVAIPILSVNSILQSKAHKIIDEIDEFSVKLMNMLKKVQDVIPTK